MAEEKEKVKMYLSEQTGRDDFRRDTYKNIKFYGYRSRMNESIVKENPQLQHKYKGYC